METVTAPTQIKVWLECAVWTLGGVLLLCQLWSHFRPRPSNESLGERHSEVDRRLGEHDRQIADLWVTMRNEIQRIESSNSAQYKEIERSLGRIEGKLDK
jgi:hypothetical protein